MDIYLERIHQRTNCCRYYTMHIARDLFADHALIVGWGRIGTRGRNKVRGSGSLGQCQALQDRILALRIRRGYRLSGTERGNNLPR